MLPGMRMNLGNFAASGAKVQDVFAATLWTGNSSTQTITTGVDFSTYGGMNWTKNRVDSSYGNNIVDTVRGQGNMLVTNSTAASVSQGANAPSFSTTGFTVGVNGNWNNTTQNYVGWSFRKAAKFFDVVTYTGNGGNQTVNHSLGITPGLIIVKDVTGGANWQCFHTSLGASACINLNVTNAAVTGDSVTWNATAPTSTTFTVGNSSNVNGSGDTYVAYLFAHDPDTTNGIIQCGSFTTNGSALSGQVTLGWEPQYVLFKRADSTSPWYILDASRGWDGTADLYLSSESSSAEANGGNLGVHNSTGFTNKGCFVSATNVIYMAIRKGPM